MRLAIMGPPGAGKGTHSKTVSDYFQIPWISTGDMFRSHISAGTPLGVLAQSYISQGDFVPDEVTCEMVRSRIQETDAVKGFLLDGYPRSIAQAQSLAALLAESGLHLNQVLYLDVSPESIVERLLHRAAIEHRADDTEPVIRHRIEVFYKNTAPLLDFYEKAQLLHRINGEGTIMEVSQRVTQSLDELRDLHLK